MAQIAAAERRRQPASGAAESTHHPDRALGVRRCRRGVKNKRARIGSPSRLIVIGVVSRELQRRATGKQTDPDLPPAGVRRYERDRLAVGRDGRRLFHADKIGQPLMYHVVSSRARRLKPLPREHDAGAQHQTCRRRQQRTDNSPPRRRQIHRVIRRVEHERRVADIAQPAARILVETAFEQPPHTGRDRHRQRVPRRLPIEDGDDGVRDGFALECALACQHLEQHAPERPDVSPLVDRFSTRLFR